MNKLVSVIVPVYNSENFIENCINSIINQTYKNIEVILVDDGSTDNSLEFCKKYESTKVKVFHKENSGVSSTRNYGMEKMNGEYFTFIDSDDYIDSNYIETMVSNLTDDLTLISVPYIQVHNNDFKMIKFKDFYDLNTFIDDFLSNKIIGSCCKYLFQTNKVKKYKIKFDINTGYMEDSIFLIEYLTKLSIKNIKVINNDSYYYYVINNLSATHSKDSLKMFSNYSYALEKIDLLTKHRYIEKINNKKIEILGDTLLYNENKKNIIETIEYSKKNISPYNYTGSKKRYYLFMKILKKENILLLNIYNIILRILIKIKNII